MSLSKYLPESTLVIIFRKILDILMTHLSLITSVRYWVICAFYAWGIKVLQHSESPKTSYLIYFVLTSYLQGHVIIINSQLEVNKKNKNMKLMYFFSLVWIGYLLNNVLLFNNRIKYQGERIYQVHVYLMHTSKQHLYITGIVCFEPLGTRWRDMAAIISSTDLT